MEKGAYTDEISFVEYMTVWVQGELTKRRVAHWEQIVVEGLLNNPVHYRAVPEVHDNELFFRDIDGRPIIVIATSDS